MKQTTGRSVNVGIMLGVVVLVGMGIRCYHLDARSLWFDEAFSWRLSQFPVRKLVERAIGDFNPPAYYILLKAWSFVFGESALALRSLSVLLAGLTIVGMYLFAREALTGSTLHTGKGSAKTGGIALFLAALVALSALQIRWAWEVRMYTLGTALFAFSSWALFRALRCTDNARRWWVLYGVLTLLFAYTHSFALFSIAGQVSFLLGWFLVSSRCHPLRLVRDPAMWHAIVGLNIALVGFLPWVPVITRQKEQVQTEYWTSPVTLEDVQNMCYKTVMGPDNVTFSQDDARAMSILCAAVLLFLVWKAPAGEWYIFTAAVTPLLLCVLFSLRGTHVFSLRFFLFAHLFFLAAVAVVVWRVPFAWGRGLLAGSVLAGFLGIYLDYWKQLDIANKPGARGAAAFIESHRQASETVVVCSPLIYYPVLFHCQNRSGVFLYHDGRGFPRYEGTAVMRPEEFIGAEELQAIGAGRVWVVNMAGGAWGTRTVPVPGHWHEKGQHRFPEVYRGCGDVIVVEYEVGANPK